MSINLRVKTWPRKTKLIAATSALTLVLAGTGGGLAYHAYAIDQGCETQTALFTTQKVELTKAVQDAEVAIALVEGDEPAAFAAGFTESTPTHADASQSADTSQSASALVDGKTVTENLKGVVKKAETQRDSAAPRTCATRDDLATIKTLTTARQADLDALKAQTAAFTQTVDQYRLAKASEEANTSMDTAKSDLAAAQKDATDQLAVVDGDTGLQGDATVKAAYDALKAVEADSHSVSTTVTVSTYDEAVASIDKAKTVAAKTGEITAASQALKDAIQAYQAAAAQAQQSASSYSGYSGGYSGSSGYSGGSSYSAPAPSNNGGGSSGGGGGNTRVDFDFGTHELDNTPGKCWYIEGDAYCNPQ